MCGIIGSVNIEDSFIEKGLLHLHKRGPDYQKWVKVNENINFGHSLLSIIGTQTQPLHVSTIDRNATLTFNGEIFNFKEFDSYQTSDSLALISHLFNSGVYKGLQDLNGQFAFGYYESQKIYLAVDRFSQKSIYYHHEGDKFAFASSPAALLHLKDKWEIDKDMLQSYWLLGSPMGSIWKGIKKLGASEMLTYDVQANTIKIERYWQPTFQDNTNDIEDLVIDAIQKVKIADVPIHIFLSGGIDSTLVASQFQGGKAIHLDSPERQYAQYVADKFGIEMNVVDPEEIKVEEYLKDYSIQCGEPTMAGLIPYVTAKESAKFGRVAISANGADELFFGYDRTSDNATQKQHDHIFRGSFYRSVYGNSPVVSWPPAGRLSELDNYVQYDLNKTLDFASMSHSLEVRCPFLDHRLVEMALSIPEHVHRKNGNKTILKTMLKKMGFDDKFLNRPKLGFSLHKQPEGMDKLISKAWRWCKEFGFLTVDDKKLSGRDKKYLEMSALGFYYWFLAWKHKIK